jgi:hypothetical protein
LVLLGWQECGLDVIVIIIVADWLVAVAAAPNVFGLGEPWWAPDDTALDEALGRRAGG